MGVFKEEAHVLETLAKQQSQIFNDAADYGVAYNTSKQPRVVKDVVGVIKKLSESDKKYPEEKKFIRNRQTWGTEHGFNKGVSLDIIIFWEQEDGIYFGTKYHISYSTIHGHSRLNKSANAMMSIDIESYKERK